MPGRAMSLIRKFYLILIVLLAGLGLACQPDLSPPRLAWVLTASWQSYSRHFINPAGRVMIPAEGGGTISEAQTYALLRAVWARDETVFNQVYAWTYQNLSRSRAHGDSLLCWRWGRRPDGSWGVLDANSAADADLDYALALVLAARQGWRAPPDLPNYLKEARRVQADILAKEVVALPDGEFLLTPGNWHEPKPPYLINPSYFSPAAYRLFGSSLTTGTQSGGKIIKVAVRAPPLQIEVGGNTGGFRWLRLRRDTYKLLQQINQDLGGQIGVGLFPDWCRVAAAGRVSPAPGRDRRFGWEAVRVPFRVALDALWSGEPQAARLLKDKFLPFFKKTWQAHGRLVAVYDYDGSPAVTYESPVLYAGVLAGALAAGDRVLAREMARKILSFYHEDGSRAYFESPDNYYANNWAWMGLALYAGWIRP
jgi:endo-1,4-beta-D-glucanase Y